MIIQVFVNVHTSSSSLVSPLNWVCLLDGVIAFSCCNALSNIGLLTGLGWSMLCSKNTNSFGNSFGSGLRSCKQSLKAHIYVAIHIFAIKCTQ